jgi:glycosyltransferase involved in cell wall biosynthesis
MADLALDTPDIMNDVGVERQNCRVLHVTAWPPDNPAGGVSTVIRILQSEFADHLQVTVLVQDWNHRQAFYRGSDKQPIIHLRMRTPYDTHHPLLGLLGWGRDFFMALRQLLKLVRRHDIDIIHLHFASAYQYYFRVLRLLLGVPYIVTFHRGDVVSYDKLTLADQWLIRWTLRGASRLTAVSQWLSRTAKETLVLSDKIVCVYNGIDIEAVRQQAQLSVSTIDRELPPRYFAMIANVAYYKGHDVAIDAWKSVVEAIPDLHLVVVGEPRDLWEECQQQIQRLGLGERIHLLGALPYAQAMQVLARAEAMVLPSRSEGLPMAILEAAVLERPVVCSDIEPFREILEVIPEAPIVPVEDANALADAVIRLAQNGDLRVSLGRRLSALVRERFSSTAMAAIYKAIYQDVLDRRN